MGSTGDTGRTRRSLLCAWLLAAGWIMSLPTEAGAQPAAEVATALASRPDRVAAPGLVLDSLAQYPDSKGLGAGLPLPSAGTSRSPSRDSIKNGVLLGAAVAAALSVVGSKIADCPDAARSCPGTKALGIGLTVAAGAAIGAGLDLLFSVDAGFPGAAAPTAVRHDIVVAGRIRW